MNRQILRGVAASAIYSATSVLVGILQLRLIVQALSADTAGLWLLFVTISGYIAFFDLGISPTVGREISFSVGSLTLSEKERTRRIGELLATLWRAFRLLAIAVAVLCLGIGEAFIHYHSRGPVESSIVWAWAIFSLGAAISLLGSTALAALFGLGDVAAEKVIRSAALVIGLVLTFAVIGLHGGILGIAAAWTVQAIANGLLAWYRLRNRYPCLSQVRYQPNWQLAKTLIPPSLKLASIQFGAILILQSANPLIAIFIGTAAIPLYEAVSKIAVTMMTLSLLIVNSSSPFISMTYAAGDLPTVKQLLLRNLRLGLGLMVVVAGFVAANGDRIVSLWLGSGKFAGFPVLWVLLLTVLLEVHHVIFATAAMAAGQVVFIRSALISGVLNITFAVVLAGRFGLLGIAVAIAVSQLLTNNWYAPYFTMRFFGMPALLLLREVWAPILIFLVLQVTVDSLIRQLPWLANSSLGSLAISGTLSVIPAASMAWLFALRSAERNWLREYFSVGLSSVKVEHA